MFLRSQLNAIYKSINEIGLNPNNFRITPSDVSLEIFYNKEFFFIIDMITKATPTIHGFYLSARIQYSPAYDRLSASYNHDFKSADFWSDLLKLIQGWLTYLKREVSEPNYWELVKSYGIFNNPKAPFDIKNECFSSEEAIGIRSKLEEIKTYLISLCKGNKELVVIVNERFNHVDEAIGRLGKKDWIMLLIGSAVTVIAALSLSPELGSKVWKMIGDIFLQGIKLLAH